MTTTHASTTARTGFGRCVAISLLVASIATGMNSLAFAQSSEYRLLSQAGSQLRTAAQGAQLGFVSADGRFVAFSSRSSDLIDGVSDPTPNSLDAFLYDRDQQQLRLISRLSPGVAVSQFSEVLGISADGRLVLVSGQAQGLIPGLIDGNGSGPELYLYDRLSDSAILVSRSHVSALHGANGSCVGILSANGAAVAMSCNGTNLIANFEDDPRSDREIYRFDVATRTVRLVSHAHGMPNRSPSGGSYLHALSEDGRTLAYESDGSNLTAIADGNLARDVFLYDALTAENHLVTVNAAGNNTIAWGSQAMGLSGDGQWVVFEVGPLGVALPGVCQGGQTAIFVQHRDGTQRRCVSHRHDNPAAQANQAVGITAVSHDGRYLLAMSRADDLVAGVSDPPNTLDVFLIDRLGGARLISRRHGGGAVGNGESRPAGLSRNGDRVLLISGAGDLIAGPPRPPSSDHLFLYDVASDRMQLADHVAGLPDEYTLQPVAQARLSSDGTGILFTHHHAATSFVPGILDLNNVPDLFLRVEGGGSWDRFHDGFEGR